MDAVKFIEECRRMCKMHKRCHGCEALLDDYSCVFGVTGDVAPIKQVEFLEKWSAAHPRKTRQSVFLEQYPEADLSTGTVNVCPNTLYSGKCDCTRYKNCLSCKREFWMQEVE